MVKVAIYIRVSTRLQEEKFSLSSQELELTKYANENNWEIFKVFKDIDSGGKLNKVGLNELLDCVEEQLVDIVLCMDQDRLSRLDTLEWELLKQTLRNNKVKIAEPHMLTDLTNENDEFISDIKNLIAKREKRTIVRRMMRGLRQYTREGNFYGKHPNEYIYDKTTKKLTINPDFNWVIPTIDKLYLDKRMGFAQIANELNRISLTPTGTRWSAVSVYNKLKNPAYHGDLIRNFIDQEQILVENVFPPLRKKEDFLLIKNQMKKRHKKRLTAHPHFLRDVTIKCSECGYILGIQTGSTKTKNHQNYYLQHSPFIKQTLKCNFNKYINTRRIRKPLLKSIQNIFISKESAENFLNYSFDRNDSNKLATDMKTFRTNLLRSENKLEKLIDLFLDGNFKKEQLNKRKEIIENEIQLLKEKIKKTERKLDLVHDNKLTYNIVIQFFSIVQTLETSASELELQQIIGDLFNSATYYFDEQKIIFHTIINEHEINLPVYLEEEQQLLSERVERNSKRRYKEYEVILQKKPGMNYKTLVRVSGYHAETVKKDIARNGPLKNMAPLKYTPMMKEIKITEIKELLLLKPDMTYKDIATAINIHPSTAARYVKEIKK